MYRRRYRRPYRKTPRPSDRIVRAGSGEVTADNTGTAYVYTAASPQTARNISLDMGIRLSTSSSQVGLAYALVYIAEGYNANALTWPALSDDLYNPTKNILISGVITSNEVEDHKWNRIGRKLMTGDRIALLIRSTNNESVTVNFELSFTTLY